ncbi:MAG: monofunctional biosynthetic peptidoglycan transglycosylase, partial [Smithellaceae bacterium]
RKHASGLSAREAATLASILPNPRRYKPNSSSRYVENRSERIYRIMLRRGIVIREYEEVINETEAEEEKVSEVPEAEGQIIDDQNVNDQKTDDQKREEKPEAEQTDVDTENNTK